MIVVVPRAIPVTTPDELPTVAIEISLLLHVPPGVMSLNVIVPPIQTEPLPAIGAVANEAKERKMVSKVRLKYFIFFVFILGFKD